MFITALLAFGVTIRVASAASVIPAVVITASPTASVPWSIRHAPPVVLAAVSVSVPAPVLTSPPEPEIVPR
jgi:hypothetical protein